MGNKDNNNRKASTLAKIVGAMIVVCLILIGAGYIIDASTMNKIEPSYVTYDKLQEALENKTLYAIYTDDYSYNVRFQYKTDIPTEFAELDPEEVSIMDLDIDKWYYTTYVPCDEFDTLVLNSGTPWISGRFTSRGKLMTSIVVSLIPICFLVVMIYAVVTMMSSQMRLGDNKFEISKDTGIKFSDVIGHDEVIEDIKGYIELLPKMQTLKELHIKPPKGILFTGAPGTGKTLMAKAMAGEAKVPFIYLNTSSVIEVFVGQGAKAIRSCFKKARELAPCVVFLDEIDAIGNKRGSSHGTSEDTQTLLALLQELDGFTESKGILVIAATNCPDYLDPALKRSGRFDREVVINLPRNRAVRKLMLEHYTRHYELDETVDLDSIAATLSGMSGADIANICNEAATISVMRNNTKKDKCVLCLDDFTQATDKLLLKGNKLQNKSLINEHDRQIVAYHEAGHAVISYLCNEPISRISIQGTTSGVGGFVMREDKTSQFDTKDSIIKQIKICYGGRCSEAIKFGADHITTGASNDIQQATDLIYRYVATYGFDNDLSLLNYQALHQAGIANSEATQKTMQQIATEQAARTTEMLKNNYELVEELVKAILEQETMQGSEVTALLDKIAKR